MRCSGSVLGVVLALVLAVAVPGVAGAAPAPGGAGCESTDALAVRYLPDDGVQIVRNTCAVPVRAIVYYRFTTNVPMGGFPSEPMKGTRWSCGGAATGPAEISQKERGSGWLVTYAKGWQIRRADGRWHMIDVVYTVPDHSAVSGHPFNNDRCYIDGRDKDWDAQLDKTPIPP